MHTETPQHVAYWFRCGPPQNVRVNVFIPLCCECLITSLSHSSIDLELDLEIEGLNIKHQHSWTLKRNVLSSELTFVFRQTFSSEVEIHKNTHA